MQPRILTCDTPQRLLFITDWVCLIPSGLLEQPQTLATPLPELLTPEASFSLTPHGSGLFANPAHRPLLPGLSLLSW